MLSDRLHLAPSSPEAWDVGTVAGAAFARYARRAIDWGGGVRWEARGVRAGEHTPTGPPHSKNQSSES